MMCGGGVLAAPEAPGLLVVGPRRSGKSWLARQYEQTLEPDALHQDVADWLPRHGPAGDLDLGARVGAEIRAALRELDGSAPRPWWVLDNAQLLLAHTRDEDLDALAERLRRGALRLVLIRNRFVDETGGWLAGRERPLAEVLRRVDIPLWTPEQSLAFAASCFERDANRDAKAQWLARWGGGTPGRMADLRVYVPQWQREGDVPEPLSAHIDRTIRLLGLTGADRSAVLTGVRDGLVPPAVLLPTSARQELGLLESVGMIPALPEGPPGDFVCEFWRAMADRLPGRRPVPTDGVAQLADRLERTLRAAGATDDLWDELSAARMAGGPAEMFERVLLWERAEPTRARPLAEVLADALGRVGLRAALRACGAPTPSGEDAAGLAVRLLGILKEGCA